MRFNTVKRKFKKLDIISISLKESEEDLSKYFIKDLNKNFLTVISLNEDDSPQISLKYESINKIKKLKNNILFYVDINNYHLDKILMSETER